MFGLGCLISLVFESDLSFNLARFLIVPDSDGLNQGHGPYRTIR